MTWQSAISDAVIETAAGDRFVFEFRDLKNKRVERTETFAFRTEGDYVQRLSSGSQGFPVTLWFSGEYCNEFADSFEAATKDPRPMKFYHPLRKKSILVQLLSLERTDALATAAGEVQFDLDLHETIELWKTVKPENVSKFIDNTMNTMKLISAAKYGEDISKKSPGDIAKIKDALGKAMAKMAVVTEAYDTVTDYVADAQSVILTAESLIETIETDAMAFAEVAFGCFRTVQNMILYVTDKIDFYRQMAAEFASGEGMLSDPATFKLMNNALLANKCSAVAETTETDYATKTAVFAMSDELFTQSAALQVIIDGYEAAVAQDGSIGVIELDVETGPLIQSIVAAAAGRLAEISYRSKQERTITLDRDMELYVLVYRLMGGTTPDELDSFIDRFIEANKLGGTELFEIKKGRRLKYYL